eukprot:9479360-Pyramimonas_sp.AAC.1
MLKGGSMYSGRSATLGTPSMGLSSNGSAGAAGGATRLWRCLCRTAAAAIGGIALRWRRSW